MTGNSIASPGSLCKPADTLGAAAHAHMNTKVQQDCTAVAVGLHKHPYWVPHPWCKQRCAACKTEICNAGHRTERDHNHARSRGRVRPKPKASRSNDNPEEARVCALRTTHQKQATTEDQGTDSPSVREANINSAWPRRATTLRYEG